MLTAEMMAQKNIVRYGELIPCKTAFIDTHTPGSDKKENFTIIGGGVSESTDQHVHIRETPGFNIGAAGQPPKCKNSLHSHRTAEVFFVLKGRWRFFWGRWGDSGEVILNEGDIFNIPTGMFRGFENIGQEYGMIMAILGGDDAGGGVVWAPQVVEEAKAHGLILGDNGRLYDQKKGESLPDGIKPMPLLTDTELKAFAEPKPEEVIPRFVARYWDLVGLAKDKPIKVIAEQGILRDKPGFEVEFLTHQSTEANQKNQFATALKHTVLMPVTGHWQLQWTMEANKQKVILNAGDSCLLPPNFNYELTPAMSGDAALYRVIATDDPAGPTHFI